jgi:hypothetical protein
MSWAERQPYLRRTLRLNRRCEQPGQTKNTIDTFVQSHLRVPQMMRLLVRKVQNYKELQERIQARRDK